MKSGSLKEKLEAKIVSVLKQDLKDQRMTGDRAQEIAKRVLELLPENMSDEQLTDMILKIGNEITELGLTVHDILEEQDRVKKELALKQMRGILEKIKSES